MEPNSWGVQAEPQVEDDADAAAAAAAASLSTATDALHWCLECRRGQNDSTCGVHGPLQHIPDQPLPPRAVSTAPSQVVVRRLAPAGDGRTVRGVFASVDIASRTLFGPLEAPLLTVPLCLGEDQFLLKKFRASEDDGYVDVTNDREGNWLIYVRPARHWAEQNLVAYQYDDEIYFAAFKFIPAHTELRVWYSEDYAALMSVELLSSESGRVSPDVSSVSPRPMDTDGLRVVSVNGECDGDGMSLNPVSSRRRKSARPQRVPQTRQPHIEVVERRSHRQQVQQQPEKQQCTPAPGLPVLAPAPPAISLILKEEPLNHVVTSAPAPLTIAPAPPALTAGDNILLICENPSANGQQATSLLLLTSGPPAALGQTLLKPSFDIPVIGDPFAHKRPPVRIQPSPSLAVTWPGTTHNSVLISANDESIGDNIRSPGERSGDSDDDSSREQRLLRASGGNLRPYICSYPACSKYFSSKYKLLRHELIHSQEKRHHCQLCHKKFHRKDHLNNHLKVHERSKVRLECGLCGCVFAKKWTYEKHLSLHERDQSRGPIPIRSMEEMGGEGEGEGEASENDEEEDEYLNRAEEEEAAADWVTVQQQSPNSAFRAADDDDDTMEQDALEEPPLSGPHLLAAVNQHLQESRVTVRPPPAVVKRAIPLSQRPSHPCDSCGKVFSASKDLRRHLQTHLGIKPNLCPYCPKKFTRKDHVRRHIQTVHGRDKEVRDRNLADNGSAMELQVLAQ